MWDTLWINARLATMEPFQPYGQVDHAAIAAHQGKIAWVGDQSDLPATPERCAVTVVDLEHRWITPGLIDCHTHLVYGGNRAHEFDLRLRGASYTEIAQAGGGIRATVAATRQASVDALVEAATKRLLALTQEGVTTVEIKSGYGLDLDSEIKILQAARQLGQRLPVSVLTTFLGAHALPPGYAGSSDDYIALICQEMLPAIARGRWADAVDVFCERIAFSVDQTARVFAAAQQYGLPVKLHADQLSDSGGAALAAQYHALSADHLEYASTEGIRAMAAAGTVAVLLPGAFYYLREQQVPPVQTLRQYNVPMAIATDCNPGTSPVTSLLLMLNMACVLFRLTPEESLLGVTRCAAQALGLGASHGTLTVGKVADLAVWEVEHPAELSYPIGYNPCVQVMKAGQTVLDKLL